MMIPPPPLEGEDRFDPDLQTVLRSIRHFEMVIPPPEPEWYGMARVITDLAGLPRGFPLHVMTHHGVVLEEDTLSCYSDPPHPVLVCRPAFVPLYGNRPDKPVIATGSIQIHYRRQRGITKAADAAGTLAFPHHSTHHLASFFDQDAYADLLAGLPPPFQPVTVCLYWKDLLAGGHVPYLKRGLRVVSAGHIFDPNFTANFYAHLRRCRFATGNAVGSQTLYALEMGIPYFISGSAPEMLVLRVGSGKYREQDFPVGSHVPLDLSSRPIAARLSSLLPRPETGLSISAELAAFVAYLHGCTDNPDRERLRSVIEGAFFRFDPMAQWLTSQPEAEILSLLRRFRASG